MKRTDFGEIGIRKSDYKGSFGDPLSARQAAGAASAANYTGQATIGS